MSPASRTMPKLTEEIERTESPFNQVVARRVGERIDLDVEGATFATWHPRELLTGYSWDALAAASVLRAGGPPESVLLLGLGGGTMLRQLRQLLPTARFVALEIDPAVVSLARRYMELDRLQAEVITVDAYAWLEDAKERFDVVIDDLFLTGEVDVFRSAVLEGHVLDRVRARVKKGGILVANMITDRGHLEVRRRMRRAFKDTFRQVRVVTPPRGLNEVLVGGDEVAPPRTARDLADRFPLATDRKLWRRLGYRSLQL